MTWRILVVHRLLLAWESREHLPSSFRIWVLMCSSGGKNMENVCFLGEILAQVCVLICASRKGNPCLFCQNKKVL